MISGMTILLFRSGPWLITMETVVPGAALPPPSGVWEMTLPFSTVSEYPSLFSTVNPLVVSVAVASASRNPSTAGTGIPFSSASFPLTVSTTLLPPETIAPSFTSAEMTRPTSTESETE